MHSVSATLPSRRSRSRSHFLIDDALFSGQVSETHVVALRHRRDDLARERVSGAVADDHARVPSKRVSDEDRGSQREQWCKREHG
jgi:hypothetical protein